MPYLFLLGGTHQTLQIMLSESEEYFELLGGNMVGKNKKYSHIRKPKSIRERILLPVGSTETMQLLLLLLVTLPLPSLASNTTSKRRGLLNRDVQGGSHLFRLDPGYNVADVPPSDGPLQIRYI